MRDLTRIKKSFSTHYHRFIFTGEAPCPATLLCALQEKLPHIAPDSWPQRFDWGGVCVNGKLVTGDVALTTPCKVEYYEPKFDMAHPEKHFAKFDPAYVIYDDGYILACFKPAMLPSVPAREQRGFSLWRALEAHLGRTIHMPSRLDMSTAGLIVVSTSSETHGSLQRLFERHRMRKIYRLETASPPAWTEQICEGPISRDPDIGALRRVHAENGKPAKTIFRVLRNASPEHPTGLIEAEPLTGRTHQIRVHASHLGAPVIGDNFYGGAEEATLHLLSYSLEFLHPKTGQALKLVVPDRLVPAWAQAAADTI